MFLLSTTTKKKIKPGFCSSVKTQRVAFSGTPSSTNFCKTAPAEVASFKPGQRGERILSPI